MPVTKVPCRVPPSTIGTAYSRTSRVSMLTVEGGCPTSFAAAASSEVRTGGRFDHAAPAEHPNAAVGE